MCPSVLHRPELPRGLRDYLGAAAADNIHAGLPAGRVSSIELAKLGSSKGWRFLGEVGLPALSKFRSAAAAASSNQNRGIPREIEQSTEHGRIENKMTAETAAWIIRRKEEVCAV